MEFDRVTQLASLAHARRLEVFRMLVRRYPQAVPAGEIATSINAKANTASAYLSTLRQAGLIEQMRDGTSLKYRAVTTEMRELIDFLSLDCCRGRPDLCLTPMGESQSRLARKARPYSVLFICTANAARSIMAESILTAEGHGLFKAVSAGTQPAAAPSQEVLDLLAAKGHDIDSLFSQHVDSVQATQAGAFDFVFTVCDHAANEECPVWPGQPMTAHWGMPDPLKATGTAAQRTLALHHSYGVLQNRIRAFVALPVETLDRLSLQSALDEIGQAAPEAILQ